MLAQMNNQPVKANRQKMSSLVFIDSATDFLVAPAPSNLAFQGQSSKIPGRQRKATTKARSDLLQTRFGMR
ncbi:MAG: hypothetical protein BVN35_00300 [Proteobacteria bacterium ST_bin11]|nr:MAG: hypothetical protein BVN35_00300 [Proteobacteria bacterium ST_bin11]